MRAPARERGFSLVELMVGMVVGLLLLGGILEILLGNRESFQTQQRQAALQENIRLSSFLVSNALPLAGLYTDGALEETDIFGADPVIVATEGGNSNQADRIRIRFEGQGAVHDCLGTEIGTPGNPEITSFEFFIDTTDNELECRVFNNDGTVSNQPLVSNVENMQIEYGLDTNANGSVDRYMEGDDANFDQAQVQSIRLQLLLASPGDVLVQPTAQTYALLDSDGANNGRISITDSLQRQVLEQVIALRNRLQ